MPTSLASTQMAMTFPVNPMIVKMGVRIIPKIKEICSEILSWEFADKISEPFVIFTVLNINDINFP